MTAEIHKLPPPKLHLYCAKCGVVSEPRCDCNVGYITAGEVARRAVAANPEKSDRAIAAEIGVSQPTVGKARKAAAAAGDKNLSSAKRTGRDGKSYPASRRTKRMPKLDEAVRILRPLYEAGTPFNEKTMLKEHGISHGTLAAAVAYLKGHHEATSEPIIDITTLSKTAQEKLAAAQRQIRRHLEAEHAARLYGLAEEVRQQVLTRNKEYLATLNKMEEEAAETKRTYREFMDRQKKIFSRDEYRLVVMCVHADAAISEDKRNEATRLLLAKRFALTGEK
jgi:hypothetical protein